MNSQCQRPREVWSPYHQPGTLLDMQTLRPHPRAVGSESLEVGPAAYMLSPPGNTCVH